MVMRISKNRVDLDDKELQRPVLKDYAEAVVTSNSGSSYTIDLEHGNVHDITLTNNCSFTFANPPASGTAGSFKLILTQDGTGGRTVTWPGAVSWVSGSAPTLNGDSGAVIILMFITTDGGTTWHGVVVETSASSATVDRQVFTADGTWNKPSSGTIALIEVWGAGGGGELGSGEIDGGGGGEYNRAIFALDDLGSSETVTVGTGGSVESDGGDSSFGSWLDALGGESGVTGGGGGGQNRTGSVFVGGSGGSEDGESVIYSGAGGAGGEVGDEKGGTSLIGGDGGDAGSNGSAPGGGGGSNAAGARGEVRVTVW